MIRRTFHLVQYRTTDIVITETDVLSRLTDGDTDEIEMANSAVLAAYMTERNLWPTQWNAPGLTYYETTGDAL